MTYQITIIKETGKRSSATVTVEEENKIKALFKAFGYLQKTNRAFKHTKKEDCTFVANAL